MQEARFFQNIEDDKILCTLCPKTCLLKAGEEGFCRARKNEEGILYSLNYGQITSLALDPIEKKPLYHFYPGSPILSLGSWGCNFDCAFCQNWRIAQANPSYKELSPKEIIKIALFYQEKEANIGLAYTYSEPLVCFEYILEVSKLAKKEGLKNILVTNGFINPRPFKELLPYLDALNIDLKSFNQDYYKNICQGELEPVKKIIKLASRDCHVELTTLLLDGLNDSKQEIEYLSLWIKDLNPLIPLHFSRYFPNYQMNLPPTSIETMLECKKIAQKYLPYVYLGNLGEEGQVTLCPSCGKIIVKRWGYKVEVNNLEKGRCTNCGSEVNLIID